MPTLPYNLALKNFTALELGRFIDKRLTDVSKSKHVENPNKNDTMNALELADDSKGRKMRSKLQN